MKTISKKLVLIGTSLLAFAGSALASGPEYVRVRSLSYAGTGCPAGTVASNVSPDNQALTLLFDSYFAEVGPGLPLSAGRKNCQVVVSLDFPPGWSYTLATVDYRGFLSLDAGVTATQSSSYYFQGGFGTGTLSTTVAGPVARDYQIRDVLGLSAQVWSPCGANRALNINTQVRADNSRNRNGRGLITKDSIDLTLKQIYGITWRRC